MFVVNERRIHMPGRKLTFEEIAHELWQADVPTVPGRIREMDVEFTQCSHRQARVPSATGG